MAGSTGARRGAGRGTPDPVRALYAELPFNDAERTRTLIRRRGDRLAAVVFEPVILEPPRPEWIAVVQEETRRVGAVLIVDEIKTVCRLAIGGGCERFGIRPDLVVLGKAIANGFPLAAVGGRAEVMEGVRRTWISSTLATEMVALAAARATLEVMVSASVPAHLERVGGRLLAGLDALAERHPAVVTAARGIGPMCHLEYRSEPSSGRLARERPGGACSSSAAPTTSFPWRTTRRRWTARSACWTSVLQALAP